MTLPNLIGIGAEKCGSTWLYLLLKSHDEIYMSERRKEIGFFNTWYEEGLDWYESFFPDNLEAKKFSIIGEFTPAYLYNPICAERIASLCSVEKLLLILRNPVDQMYSYYGQAVRDVDYQNSFEIFLKENPKYVDRGFHYKHLKPFFDFYKKEQILCLVFEDSIKNIDSTKQIISHFLDVDPNKFPTESGNKRANGSYIPKYKKLNFIANKTRNFLVNNDQDWLINLAKSVGIQTLLQKSSTKRIPTMSQEIRHTLLEKYLEDINELECQLNIDLSIWKKK